MFAGSSLHQTPDVEAVAHQDLQLGDPNCADFLFLFISSKLTVVAVDSSPAVWSRLNSVELEGMFVLQISSRDLKKNDNIWKSDFFSSGGAFFLTT